MVCLIYTGIIYSIIKQEYTLIILKVYPGAPLRVEYSITDNGKDVLPIYIERIKHFTRGNINAFY